MAFFADCKMALITFTIITVSVYFALMNHTETNNGGSNPLLIFMWPSSSNSSSRNNKYRVVPSISFPDDHQGMYMSIGEESDRSYSLQYDFYRKSCPSAEKIVRDVFRGMYGVKPSVAPALLRLMFHDCFIEGCDASVLLDPDEGVDSEKDSPPNRSLKGFDAIDIIKSELEKVCPGIVSCADILVLAAREAIVVTGGPFYPLYTGRKDSLVAFQEIATYEFPSPQADLFETLASFASRGFDERETVGLLGAHSIGMIHCRFLEDRLYRFSGTGQADPSIDPELLKELKKKCPAEKGSPPTWAPSTLSPCRDSAFGPSADIKGSDMNSGDRTDQGVGVSDHEANGADGFGMQYYRSLLQNRGLLFADQQLMAGEETGIWVRAYASDPVLFHRDFAMVMMKLSNLNVLTGPLGQIRRNCSKVMA